MVKISGGDRLEAALAEIAKKLSTASTLSVGFLEGSQYSDGTSVPMVAAVQEFGAPARNIPPRPFFRDMIAAKSPEWPEAVGDLLISNDYDASKTLGQTGAAIKGQLQQSIADFNGVPLSEATIAKKGSSKQLIDTSVMINSVDFEVK
ncbi:hypothetical protein EV217_2866 [Phyllobacterium myrsinacearum]|uniref:hypothetical protein n=1 Tax=Phyllobacterium myrsinacearum TaxID=28101 RepID=UPI0010EEE79F|nr:hypothetical protein [Phyllobacterium myrsinacearum]RZS82053.1 hypothetical protein EV217_2866 [Phyllobacterium myrsinacearum]